ncbi:MAG: Si-specific NAD(P)(+) transhydrogenase, partial [Leptospiraceae bacterium]|nr:Si-specific NAD(P)(+) transhydrogenase [Leptospiraceae bacterium]
MENEFDLIVIGGGPAGEKAAAKASYFGKKVALVEQKEKPGGAGVNTGTLPSKTLKETALFLSGKQDKGLFGIDRDLKRNVSIDDFYYRKNFVTNSEVDTIIKNLINHQIKTFQGKAEFIDKNTIQIGFQKIKGKFILIATGSYPFHPEHIPFDKEKIHDSDSILELKRFPKSLCVLGAGVIGCEYATIFGTMGIPVYLIDGKDKILPFLDFELSMSLVDKMKNDGINVIFNNGVKEIIPAKKNNQDLKIILNSGDTIESDMFLFAAGRSGNTKSLKLDKLGLSVNKRELIEVNEKYQTNIPNIFAVGDVIGFPSLASTSMDQGRAAVTHIFGTEGVEKLAPLFPYGIYTVPEVSMVGMTEDDVISKGINFCTGKARYSDMPRGKIIGAKDGFLKIIFDRDSLIILGVHIIGYLATEIIHYGLTLVENKKKVDELISEVFNYPTLHDLYKYAAYDGLGNLSGHKIKI